MSNSSKTANWENIYFNSLLELPICELYFLLDVYKGCFPSSEEEIEVIRNVLEFKKTPLGELLC